MEIASFWSGEIEIGLVKIGDWVGLLVEFQGKKLNSLYYAGKVLEVNETVKVSFLKKQRGTTFVFPTVEEESHIEMSQIKEVLPAPVERRGYYTFNVRFPNISIV